MLTPKKLSLAQRHKNLERFCNQLKLNSDNAVFVANALMWRLGLKNRDEVKTIVDAFMAHMNEELKKAKEKGSVQVMDGFLDPAILAKVAEHDTDSSVSP